MKIEARWGDDFGEGGREIYSDVEAFILDALLDAYCDEDCSIADIKDQINAAWAEVENGAASPPCD